MTMLADAPYYVSRCASIKTKNCFIAIQLWKTWIVRCAKVALFVPRAATRRGTSLKAQT